MLAFGWILKLHKIHDRISNPTRLDAKDAHDVYRLLYAIDTPMFVTSIDHLFHEEMSAQVTKEALDYLDELFAQGSKAQGSRMAGAAEELIGDPLAVAESVSLLAQDLLGVLNSKMSDGHATIRA